jgi:hypothetical protein
MFVMKDIQFLLCLLVLNTPLAVLRAQTNIAADDPNIQYIGRFDPTTPTAPAFDWSYCCISAKFQGTSCSVKLGGTSKYFDLYVDGAKTGSLKSANGGLETLVVASGLADGVHSVALCRRDEASKGLNTFQGFVPGKPWSRRMPGRAGSLNSLETPLPAVTAMKAHTAPVFPTPPRTRASPTPPRWRNITTRIA